MPPKKSKATKHTPAPPAPPAPPASSSIPPSEQTATVDGANINQPGLIPILTEPPPTSTHPPLLSNPVPIPVENPTVPGAGSRGRGGTKRKGGKTPEADGSGDAGIVKKTKAAAAAAVASGIGSSSTGNEGGTGGGVEDVSDIHLDGEDTDGVPVYDTCDEIRRKLTTYLRREGVTQAALLRLLHAELRGKKKTSRLQSSQLARFLQMKGANTGNTSALFYAAYVYFEKLRVKQGKPKSKHREEMERIWKKDGGFDIETPSSRGYFCGPGEYPSIDQYGRLLINGKVCH